MAQGFARAAEPICPPPVPIRRAARLDLLAPATTDALARREGENWNFALMPAPGHASSRCRIPSSGTTVPPSASSRTTAPSRGPLPPSTSSTSPSRPTVSPSPRPLSTLRTDYRPYESRRRLAASHDLFVADRAILPLLPRVLDKAFYSTKKAPIGVDFTRVGWPEQVGRLDMEEEEIVDNVMAAVEAAVEKVPKKWANVRALHLKAVDSVALPIYQVVPELGMKIEVPEIVGSGEVIDAAAAETHGKKIDKKAANAGASGRVVFANISAKRKRNKNEQIEEDVVMQEEVQVETEKKKKRKSTAVSADDSQKVGKKGKEKDKRGLENENEVKEASLDNEKIKKGKTEEGKKKKKSMKRDGEVGTDEIQEDKKIKGEKSDGKTKKLRTRASLEKATYHLYRRTWSLRDFF
ncbi:unnamed protein product [Miscanthus lutarioriparius]|uniref:Ribosomal protein L1 n=1 Tax=Miscanthus lutarioriparius TaxID=422564 RepID=A0A811RNH4_9POAL|nr:unnamed protein product [Miscanthus lutarioriparius]